MLHKILKRSLVCMLICGTALFLLPASSTEITEEIVPAELRHWHQQAVTDGFDGLVLVMQADKPLLLQAYGMADYEASKAFTIETVFDIGSLTKQFTAAAILKLQEQGKLQLDNTLGRFFPEAGDDKKTITLHQLLTHTSGIVNNLSGGDYSKVSRSTFIKRLFRSKLDTTPGSAFSYSNAGYAVLGLVIERASGQSYEQYVHQHLLKPAGIAHTGYRIPNWRNLPLAAGYELKPDSWWGGKADGSSQRWGTPLEKPWDKDGPWWNLHANGGFLSTIGDLCRWQQALQTETVLSKASTTLLFTPHVATPRAGSFYGYGWIIEPAGQYGKVVRHGGSNGIFTADMRYYTDKQLLIIFMTNNDSRFFPAYRDSLITAVMQNRFATITD
ncbi:CubicO group peptidase (beta-lactamase class C family) [Rheinheimera pacifica]|uniref:serine hydrolase domain-containing protein n=1 Tax=Rheinheimera pacifica TaxID=173990 RepID=UPI002168C871|nr:serine hydrolase domain-containing protein [Rheinheimera pacifica]MCS4307894.1 CubicO group peptidase (beta-lactamase class C family) [Rheinheimera pacifica]